MAIPERQLGPLSLQSPATIKADKNYVNFTLSFLVDTLGKYLIKRRHFIYRQSQAYFRLLLLLLLLSSSCLSSRAEYRARTGTATRGRGLKLVLGSGKVKGLVFGNSVDVAGSGRSGRKSRLTGGAG